MYLSTDTKIAGACYWRDLKFWADLFPFPSFSFFLLPHTVASLILEVFFFFEITHALSCSFRSSFYFLPSPLTSFFFILFFSSIERPREGGRESWIENWKEPERDTRWTSHHWGWTTAMEASGSWPEAGKAKGRLFPAFSRHPNMEKFVFR